MTFNRYNNLVPKGKAGEAKQRGEWVNMDLKEKVSKTELRETIWGKKMKAKSHTKSKNYTLSKDK